MIRAETSTHWILITHSDHARLAGDFADAWGNAQFAPPEPFPSIRYAVHHHDDGWLERDAAPHLTPAGKPEAFTRALVGAYSAFEEIDLPSYLQVRAQATAAVARQDPTAGIVVSLHTVNLLTEQADVSTIRPEHREAHRAFVAQQQAWQHTERERLGLDPAALQRGFEFLQACDNLSLIACSGFDAPRALRHLHPDRTGQRHELHCHPHGDGTFSITPWPFGETTLRFQLPFKQVAKTACHDLASFRAAFAAAPLQQQTVTLLAA